MRLLLHLDLRRRFLPWVDSDSTHLLPFVIALALLFFALAFQRSHCISLAIALFA
jgi:hypothetical protein